MSAPRKVRRGKPAPRKLEARKAVRRVAGFVIPPCGELEAFGRLMNARCPWCNGAIIGPSTAGGVLSWGCWDGCNP